MRWRLGDGARYHSFGDHWGWYIGFSRYGLRISTPFLDLSLNRRSRWYGEKECLVCGKGHSGAHPDPCLGELKGVTGACCGHGDRAHAYIGFENGTTIREFLVSTPFEVELDLTDYISDEDPEELRSRVVDVTFPVHIDNLKTAEDYEGLARMAVDMVLYDIDRGHKIQRAAGIEVRDSQLPENLKS